ncbi:MAG: DUF971 domain-containing protein [Bacillati bacterium ANGP1]|uniref:DUF971 domain-containing protein n=1 Tax=Candidatus Segetimicrobium genomatis TaxID=2569760 RepID=A0A537JUR3_9BACT|nr:MAG: DUF971 domain-containing protein [Terrabacteria group bacterium ANGP1]
MPRMPVPGEISQDPAGTLTIVWDDGHRSRYSFRTLRERCPCAFCIDEWTGEQRLDPSKVPQGIHPKEIGRVGAYALRFTWSDGHLTGLYTFKFLRDICECDDCARRRASAPPCG